MGCTPIEEVPRLKVVELGLKAALHGNIKYLFHIAEMDVHILRQAGWQEQERRAITQSQPCTSQDNASKLCRSAILAFLSHSRPSEVRRKT